MMFKTKNLLLVFIFITATTIGKAQKKRQNTTYEITYKTTYNGKKIDESPVYNKNGVIYFSAPEDKNKIFVDMKKGEKIKMMKLKNKTVKFSENIIGQYKPIETATKKLRVMGKTYKCHYAKYSIRSNTYEYWYTTKTKTKGLPDATVIPDKNALILKTVMNGNMTITIQKIRKIKKKHKKIYKEIEKEETLLKNEEVIVLEDKAALEEMLIKSRFRSVQIFKDQIINFENVASLENTTLKNDTVYRFAKGTVVMKKIKLTEAMKKSKTVFAHLNCRSNGDAYDRTGSVFMIPAKNKKELSLLDGLKKGVQKLPITKDNKGSIYQGFVANEKYNPPVEWMRFFTSFGAGAFSEKIKIKNYHWAKNVRFKQEISDVIPNDEEEIWVGVFIGNWSGSGYKIDLQLDFHPDFVTDGDNTRKKFIKPLFQTVNLLEVIGQHYSGIFKNDTLRMNFNIKENVENLELLFTTTGHGGWSTGDEFTPRLNEVFIDGKRVFNITPWRSDCASYRFSNPASGNFSNGISSSDLSRSNWCPATVTPPYRIALPQLKKGKHSISIAINQGKDVGKHSSFWQVSGVLIGSIKP